MIIPIMTVDLQMIILLLRIMMPPIRIDNSCKMEREVMGNEKEPNEFTKLMTTMMEVLRHHLHHRMIVMIAA